MTDHTPHLSRGGAVRQPHPRAEHIAQRFHDAYELLAPEYGWKPQAESSVAWEDVPAPNRNLMIATVTELLNRGVIR